MEANNHVNNVIIEYVEGIEVVKAFNQSTSSYEKFVGAVKSFKDFTLAWFQEYLENNEPDDGDYAHYPVGGTSHRFAAGAEWKYHAC